MERTEEKFAIALAALKAAARDTWAEAVALKAAWVVAEANAQAAVRASEAAVRAVEAAEVAARDATWAAWAAWDAAEAAEAAHVAGVVSGAIPEAGFSDKVNNF